MTTTRVAKRADQGTPRSLVHGPRHDCLCCPGLIAPSIIDIPISFYHPCGIGLLAAGIIQPSLPSASASHDNKCRTSRCQHPSRNGAGVLPPSPPFSVPTLSCPYDGRDGHLNKLRPKKSRPRLDPTGTLATQALCVSLVVIFPSSLQSTGTSSR